ncbi:angio-associated migratory cell protein [Epargyreus clarus]|uniref:angio-associated migratory cell protein n=1 Tax=Epargyreus clarus TaxID=520877 RepID=UPI003C2FC8DA
MKDNKEDTPPSSIDGDEITGMEADQEINFDEMEEVQLEDLMEGMSEYGDEDNSLLAFTKHKGSVFCCDFHPSGKFAVSGGEDDKAFVWSVETGDVIMECTGHKDSVIFVGFSFDGAYLATADMSGVIKVWKCNFEENQNEPWPLAFEYEANDLNWGLWHFGARVLICGAVTGDVFVFKIPSGETKVLQGHNVKSECGKLFQDGVRLAVGYEDGAIKVWDLKTALVLQQVPPGIHTIRVTAIDTHPDNNLMASISTDGKVVLTTSTNGKIVGQIDYENDLETIAFPQDPQLGYFALGTLDGSVSIWDLGRQMIRHHCAKSDEDFASGVTKMIWVKNHLITGCLDGTIRVYEGNSGTRTHTLIGHGSEVLDLSYNEKENIILTTSNEGMACVFKYEEN